MFIGSEFATPAGTAEISVLIGGEPLPLHKHPAGGRVYAAGVPGLAYTLQVRNLTPGRIEILTAVDGRNTLKDEPADVHTCTGLVIAGHATGEFTGWRISDNETRAFIFADPASSVAAQATGTADGTGVIGFAVYTEHIRRPDPQSYLRASGAPAGIYAAAAAATMGMPAPADISAASSSNLGTGIGATRTDRVDRTEFRRLPGQPDILAIGYDTAAALAARGILGPPEPAAFPGTPTGYEKYATS